MISGNDVMMGCLFLLLFWTGTLLKLTVTSQTLLLAWETSLYSSAGKRWLSWPTSSKRTTSSGREGSSSASQSLLWTRTLSCRDMVGGCGVWGGMVKCCAVWGGKVKCCGVWGGKVKCCRVWWWMRMPICRGTMGECGCWLYGTVDNNITLTLYCCLL